MFLNKIRLSLIFILILFALLITKTFSSENKIIVKVNNEIITFLDIVNEIKYLKALNPNLNNLEQDSIYEIAKNSLVREKLKK